MSSYYQVPPFFISILVYTTNVFCSFIGIAMGYGLEAQVSIPGEGKVFLFFTASIPDLEPITN
jgi:hypothetical protein